MLVTDLLSLDLEQSQFTFCLNTASIISREDADAFRLLSNSGESLRFHTPAMVSSVHYSGAISINNYCRRRASNVIIEKI